MSTLTAVYDLAVSPPTYDFLSFLCSAEKYRKEQGHKDIDLVFVPGPNKGFRDDRLPPEIEEREGMLWRVCVGISRLLPTVRNITVLKSRYKISVHVFPKGWKEESPVSHYGTYLFKDAPKVLTATEVARRDIKNKYPIPYVTITLRNSSYWMGRNSALEEWEVVADEIEKMGFEVVWVPETGDADAIPASWDIDLRAALYQGAVCNLGVSNGPMYLAVFLDAPYLIFHIIEPSCPSTTESFLLSHGLKIGDQISPNGRLVWEDDTATVILRAFKSFLDK